MSHQKLVHVYICDSDPYTAAKVNNNICMALDIISQQNWSQGGVCSEIRDQHSGCHGPSGNFSCPTVI